jgi:hypothetical protein
MRWTFVKPSKPGKVTGDAIGWYLTLLCRTAIFVRYACMVAHVAALAKDKSVSCEVVRVNPRDRRLLTLDEHMLRQD